MISIRKMVAIGAIALWVIAHPWEVGHCAQVVPTSQKGVANQPSTTQKSTPAPATSKGSNIVITCTIGTGCAANQPVTKSSPAPATAAKGLNIVFTCSVGTGCNDPKTKVVIPPYKGPVCAVLDGALTKASDEVLASAASFISANVMPQAPFSIKSLDNLLIVSSSGPIDPKKDPAALALLENEVVGLLGVLNTDKNLIPPIQIRLDLPARSITSADTASAFQSAAGANFALQPLTGSKMIVSAAGGNLLTCNQWQTFLQEAGLIVQSAPQVSSVYRTYEIDASDTAAALNAIAVAKGTGGQSTNSPDTNSNQGGENGGEPASSAPGTSTGNSETQSTDDVSGSATSDPSNSSTGVGSNTATTSQAAAKKSGSNSANGLATASGNTPSSAPAATSFPLGHPGDDLVLLNSAAGDSGIPEKQRILAAMDLPRPQMIINGTVLQSSTKDARKSVRFRNAVTQFINEQNDSLQKAVLVGWEVLRARIVAGAGPPPALPFFEHDFIDYVTERKAYTPLVENNPSPSTLARAVGGMKQVNATISPPFCAAEQYCLGYTGLFQYPQPRLTDLLLSIIAARDPSGEASIAVNCVEFGNQTTSLPPCNPAIASQGESNRRLAKKLDVPAVYQQIVSNPAAWPPADPDMPCEKIDLAGLAATAKDDGGPNLFLECFRRTVAALAPSQSHNSALGPARAALADFLFNYKMSQMYPHEFTPYDLTQSAVALDQALEGPIDAFNRDVAAFQMYWQARIDDWASKVIGEKQVFYGGVISVRTVGGNQSSASSTTQSFLNISQAPQIGTLLSNVASAASKTGPSGLLSGLSGNQAQALTAALQSYQTTEAQIGRSLSVQVQPRSLAGASSAEMDVAFHADESAAPSYWSNPPANNSTGPDLSRVATHDISTHVRVDSLKLFEISSMTAILRSGRTKFPLLPPAVEIPYIGTLVGIPLPQAKSYQTSTAILSAVVVPTASDLASGLRFRSDLVLVSDTDMTAGQTCNLKDSLPLCSVRRANTMEDIGGRARLIEFNRQMVECYANGGTACYARTFPEVLAPNE